MVVATQTKPSTEQIIHAQQRDVWRFLVALGCEAAEADDLTQETFLAVLRSKFEYRGEQETAAWLRRSAKNLFISSIRKRRRAALAPNLDDADVDWAQYQAAMPEDERIAWLRECVTELAERAQQALKQRYEDGLSREEMASRLGMEASAVRSLLERARQRLRECVERKQRRDER
jgi:RNA polymerase sigma-70 factor (ECF subfamily)